VLISSRGRRKESLTGKMNLRNQSLPTSAPLDKKPVKLATLLKESGCTQSSKADEVKGVGGERGTQADWNPVRKKEKSRKRQVLPLRDDAAPPLPCNIDSGPGDEILYHDLCWEHKDRPGQKYHPSIKDIDKALFNAKIDYGLLEEESLSVYVPPELPHSNTSQSSSNTTISREIVCG
jgi:hypothetical protein